MILKMKKFMIQWRKFELKRSYINELQFFGFYFDFSSIFPDLIPLKKGKKGSFNRAGPAKLMWCDADTWRGHASPRGCLCGACMP